MGVLGVASRARAPLAWLCCLCSCSALQDVTFIVIGRVTDDSARILLELDAGGTTGEPPEPLTLIEDGTGAVKSPDAIASSELAKLYQGGRPLVIHFSGLAAATKYSVSLAPGLAFRAEVPGSGFRTQVAAGLPPGGMRIGAVSCNKIRLINEGKTCTSLGACEAWAADGRKVIAPLDDAWHGVANDHTEFDLLLHLGDEVYQDDDLYRLLDPEGKGLAGRSIGEIQDSCEWWKARDDLAPLDGSKVRRPIPRSQWDGFKEAIAERFRGQYRATWQHPPIAKTLANVPNLFLADDHDLRDDFGDKHGQDGFPDDFDENDIDNYIARIAYEVAWEYQYLVSMDRDEARNLMPFKITNPAHYWYRAGSVGFIFVDVRVGKVFHHGGREADPQDESHLGRLQWADLRLYLGEPTGRQPSQGGEQLPQGSLGPDVDFLVVATPMPVAYFTEAALKVGSKQIDDMEGMWGMKPAEQAGFFELLSCWKHRKASREIVVVAGDVHHGVKTVVRKDKQDVFYQLITSAVGNFALPGWAGVGANFVFNKLHRLSDHWSFGHQKFLTDEVNYGTIKLFRATRSGIANQSSVALQNWVSDGGGGRREGKEPVLGNVCKPVGAECSYVTHREGIFSDTISECCQGSWCSKRDDGVCEVVPGLESRQCRGMIAGQETDPSAEKPEICNSRYEQATLCAGFINGALRAAARSILLFVLPCLTLF